MLRKIITATVAAAAIGGSMLAATAASAQNNNMIIGDPGVYLSSTHTLTLAAPNNVLAGKAAVLKTCNGNGDCTVFANLKGTETFDVVLNTTKVYAPDTIPTGFRIRLHGTNWVLTNRGTSVVWEQDGNFASQNWNGSTATNTTVSTGVVVLTNQKTGLNLTHTFVQPYAPLTVAASLTHWGFAS
jgi:hypothetical protein